MWLDGLGTVGIHVHVKCRQVIFSTCLVYVGHLNIQIFIKKPKDHFIIYIPCICFCLLCYWVIASKCNVMTWHIYWFHRCCMFRLLFSITLFFHVILCSNSFLCPLSCHDSIDMFFRYHHVLWILSTPIDLVDNTVFPFLFCKY